jgi:hypothetical protein
MTFSVTTLNTMTHDGLNCDTQHKRHIRIATLGVSIEQHYAEWNIFYCYAVYLYAECCYAVSLRRFQSHINSVPQ